jgi:hypothetical protein
MTYYDVFNGDADGICSLQQLRLSNPVESTLVTGLKRDISLLNRINATDGDSITVLDISLDKNREDLIRLLSAGAEINYFDHHFAGEIPVNPRLNTFIDTSSEICTSILVNNYLNQQYLPWAVVGAFGDNMYETAIKTANPLGLSNKQLDSLCELGTCINYNGYGIELSDLHFQPDDLFRKIHPYTSPFDFIDSEPAYKKLLSGYKTDIEKADELSAELEESHIALYTLPDLPWARRVSGVFGNKLARNTPDKAHALLTKLDDGYRVSVRAPLNTKEGADTLCRKFPTGGGRKGAAGINHLPLEMFGSFVDEFRKMFN